MGILGKKTPAANTETLLYKCPTGKQAVFSINGVNTNTIEGELTISVVTDKDFSISSITMTNKGTGLVAIPTLTIAGASSTAATAVVTNVLITELNAIVPGTGYAIDNILTIVGGTGTAATAKVTSVDANGGVTSVQIVTGGAYTAVITGTSANVTGGTGTGCTFTVTGIKYGINTVTVTNAGNGYLIAPTITVSSGSSYVFNINLTTIVEVTDAIEYKVKLAANGGVIERTGIIISQDDSIFIKSSIPNINVLAYGIESIN